MNDTDPATQKLLYQLLASLSPEERLARMLNLCTFGRQLMLADIKEKHPQASDSEIRRLFAIRLRGPEFASRYLAESEG